MNGWAALRQAAQSAVVKLRDAEVGADAQQERWLLDLLRRNADSRIGRRHAFSSIHSIADYRRAVPIVRHADITGDIAAIADGADKILTVEPIIAFEETSGSTTGSKLIPYTASGLAAFEASALAWLERLMRAYPAITEGSAYWSISPAGRAPRLSPAGIPIGFASDAGYFSPATGAALGAISAVPFSAGALADHASWQVFTLRALLSRADLTFISVWNPTFLTLLLDAIPAHAEVLLAAIHEGISGAPDQARARCLEKLLRAPDARQIWPRLALVSAWGDGAARMPFESLRDRLSGIAFDAKGLMATEGFVTISDPARLAATPALTAGFLEFISDDDTSHTAGALAPGHEYRVVITTESGLYRYDLGDRVRCLSVNVNSLPALAFIGRTDLTADLVGEKLGEAFVAHCFATAGISGILAPQAGAPSRYAVLLDTAGAAPDLALLDRLLSENPHYAYARRLGQLGPLVQRRCRDLDAAYLAFRTRQGRRLGDIKPPLLFATPEESAPLLSEFPLENA